MPAPGIVNHMITQPPAATTPDDLITRKFQPRPRARRRTAMPMALCTWCDRPSPDIQDGLCRRCYRRETQGRRLAGSPRKAPPAASAARAEV